MVCAVSGLGEESWSCYFRCCCLFVVVVILPHYGTLAIMWIGPRLNSLIWDPRHNVDRSLGTKANAVLLLLEVVEHWYHKGPRAGSISLGKKSAVMNEGGRGGLTKGHHHHTRSSFVLKEGASSYPNKKELPPIKEERGSSSFKEGAPSHPKKKHTPTQRRSSFPSNEGASSHSKKKKKHLSTRRRRSILPIKAK